MTSCVAVARKIVIFKASCKKVARFCKPQCESFGWELYHIFEQEKELKMNKRQK